MGAWTNRDMAPDDALLHRLLDELERTNAELDSVVERLRQVDINVNRLDRVEEGLGKLQRRIEGEDGLSDRVAILFDAASKGQPEGKPSKGQLAAVIGLIATFLGVLGTIVVEMIRAMFSKLGGGP